MPSSQIAHLVAVNRLNLTRGSWRISPCTSSTMKPKSRIVNNRDHSKWVLNVLWCQGISFFCCVVNMICGEFRQNWHHRSQSRSVTCCALHLIDIIIWEAEIVLAYNRASIKVPQLDWQVKSSWGNYKCFFCLRDMIIFFNETRFATTHFYPLIPSADILCSVGILPTLPWTAAVDNFNSYTVLSSWATMTK